MIPTTIKIKPLPSSPGVYFMKNARGQILYIGKAGNLKRRVNSYFNRTNENRIERLVSSIRRIDFETTDTAIEALIREAFLIKKYQPPFNVLEKDDKSFLYAEFTREPFPRVLLTRGKDLASNKIKDRSLKVINYQFGPFTSSASLRKALKLLRHIFPYSIHPSDKVIDPRTALPVEAPKERRRACFEYEVGLCPGTCVGAITKSEYRKNIKNLRLFFQGKKKQIIRTLKKEMKLQAKTLKFEQAEKIKRQLFALQHIQDVALIGDSKLKAISYKLKARIEGYDISNISGAAAVGAMVVFIDNQPDKSQYRKFRIKSVAGPNDVAMLREVLLRRFAHRPSGAPRLGAQTDGWPLPELILIDGGKPQVNTAQKVLARLNLKIPIIGIAKGPTREKNEFFGLIPEFINKKTLVAVRDEAHRFAIQYHKTVRTRKFFQP